MMIKSQINTINILLFEFQFLNLSLKLNLLWTDVQGWRIWVWWGKVWDFVVNNGSLLIHIAALKRVIKTKINNTNITSAPKIWNNFVTRYQKKNWKQRIKYINMILSLKILFLMKKINTLYIFSTWLLMKNEF